MIVIRKSAEYKPVDLLNSLSMRPQLFNSLVIHTTTDGSVRVMSDIELLLRQQEYLSCHPELLHGFFENLSPQNPLKEFHNKLSDDDLAKFIKSRRFQTPSELEQYSEYLLNCSDEMCEEFRQDVNSWLAERQSDDDVPDGNVDKPVVSPKTE